MNLPDRPNNYHELSLSWQCSPMVKVGMLGCAAGVQIPSPLAFFLCDLCLDFLYRKMYISTYLTRAVVKIK